MARSVHRKVLAASALAVAGSTILATAGAAAPAAAATHTVPAYYSGATLGDVVQVTLRLPAAIPGLPNPLGLGLISAKGTALHNHLKGAVDQANAFAGLASGTLVDGSNAPLSFLGRSVNATLSATSKADTLATIPSNPLVAGALGKLTALVDKATDGNVSTANLAHINIGTLANLLNSLPGGVGSTITSTLQNTVSQLQSSVVTPTLDNVVSTLQGIVSQVPDPTGTTSDVLAAVKQLQQQLESKDLLSNLLSKPLVALDTLDAKQAIDQVRGGAKSQAHVTLAGINVLGGLVNVKAFTSDATAFANGKAGGANAAVNPTIADANIDHSLLDVKLDPSGLGLSVAGLPSQVVDQVNAALQKVEDTVNGLLDTIGVRVTPSYGVTHVASNGRTASATGGALDITLQLPGQKSPNLDVRLGGTTAQSAVTLKPTRIVEGAPSTPKNPHLAFTGANLPLIGGAALVLFAVAVVIRRRLIA